MAAPKQYRLPAWKNSRNTRFHWLLIVLALVALGRIWWRSALPAEPKSKKSFAEKHLSRPATNSPRTVPSVLHTNASVITLAPTNLPAAPSNQTYPRPVRNIFEAQFALDRLGISSGSLDGKSGSQTRAAFRAFQLQQKLPATGELDAATKARLRLTTPPLLNYVVTSNDLARLQPVGKTWLAKSQQTALDYETILELLAESGHAHPALIRRLNPSVDWTNGVAAGTVVQIPDADRADPPSKAAYVKISLADKILEAFDEQTNLLAHFPCSIAQRVEKRPVGELQVAVVAPNPNYTFDPVIFPESPEARELKTKLVIPPGPNNPVGVVWIGLDKPGYGMHGTPSPEMVGRTESHGCFRLANWNAAYLLKLVWIGMPVYVEP